MLVVTIKENNASKLTEIPVKGIEAMGNEILLKGLDKSYILTSSNMDVLKLVFKKISMSLREGSNTLDLKEYGGINIYK